MRARRSGVSRDSGRAARPAGVALIVAQKHPCGQRRKKAADAKRRAWRADWRGAEPRGRRSRREVVRGGAKWCEGRYAAALGGMRWPFGGIRCCAFGAPHGRPSRRS
ncbi:hypothetical protein WI24_14520 [Burkholderia thailandensis]|nr:hypothetical protein WI24_14520 [Burkholderia thailandensis]